MTKSLSLYIHWPFCKSKCPYCDFNSHVPDGTVDEKRWVAALNGEMAHFAAESTDKSLKTIFFGGGTPSTMSPETAARLIEAAKDHWNKSDDLEVTLEANPTSVEAGKLTGFAEAGVNRLSLGVQSFSDKSLKFLGREHSSRDALNAISLACETFERFSFDLIYGLPAQSLDGWKTELNQALELAGGHLSAYQLSVEKGTPFYRDHVLELDPDQGADFFNLIHEVMALSGYDHYEISNYAKPGHACRHNVEIWQGGDYAGIGPGAHARLSGEQGTDAIYQIHDPARWLAKVEKEGHGTARRAALSPKERAEEIIMTGLRLSDGVERAHFQAVSGQALEKTLNVTALEVLLKGGFLIFDDLGLRTTPEGRLCLNAVLGELL